jgi:hypothetical protein
MSILLFFSACLFQQPEPKVEIIYDEIEINGFLAYQN